VNYQLIACEHAKSQAEHGTLDEALPRPFGYYWIQVEQDSPWIAAFWYTGGAGSAGFFDCSNTPGLRHVFQVHAVGEPVAPPQPVAVMPEAHAEGYHWVQSELCGDWVLARWRNEPFNHRGKAGHGYFDGSNWWNSNYHLMPTLHAYGGEVVLTA
jgi:hypothetical protein